MSKIFSLNFYFEKKLTVLYRGGKSDYGACAQWPLIAGKYKTLFFKDSGSFCGPLCARRGCSPSTRTPGLTAQWVHHFFLIINLIFE